MRRTKLQDGGGRTNPVYLIGLGLVGVASCLGAPLGLGLLYHYPPIMVIYYTLRNNTR